MTPSLRLWYSPGACSLAPHVLLYESGLPFTTLRLDITKTGGFPAEHKKINPKGRIPILEYGGEGASISSTAASGGSTVGSAPEILTETTAIMTLTSLLVPDKDLLGSTPLEVARTYEWLNWLSGTVHERGLGTLFNPQWQSDEAGAHEAIRKKAREWLETCFGMIEERLREKGGGSESGGHYSVGERFTAADVFLWVVYRWGYLLQMEMGERYPCWARVVETVVKRESVRRAVEAEGIPLVRDDRMAGLKPEDVSRGDVSRGDVK